MLSALLLGIGGLVGLLVCFVVWRIVATVLASNRRTEEILRELAPVTDRLTEGREPMRDDLLRFAAEPRTRNALLELLAESGRGELFPAEYRSAEALAESDLVFWLCHPNELQQAPDEMELMGRFERKLAPSDRTGTYYLFRFRVKEPHWAAADGWMAGIAGPHPAGDEPEPMARGTFSDFSAYAARTPEAHVDAVHEIMVQKGVYADWAEEDAQEEPRS